MSLSGVAPRRTANPIELVADTSAAPHHFVPALTGVRALAALWVVSYHLIPEVQALAPGWLFHLYDAVAAFGYLGVDVFFILSGFILAMNYAARLQQPEGRQRHILKFFWARFARVYPVHLFTLLLLVPAAMVLRHLGVASEPGRFTLGALISNLFLVQAWRLDTIPHLTWNTPSWSVSCEWMAYLLFPLLLLTVYTVRGRAATVAASFACALMVPLLIFVSGRLTHFGYTDHLIRIAGEFVAGLLAYRAFHAGVGRHLNWTRVLGGTLLLGVAVAALLLHLGFENFAYLLVPLFLVLIYGLAQGRNRFATLLSGPGFVYWGAASYSLYMTHNLWLMVVKAVLPTAHFAHSGLLARAAVLGLYTLPLFVIAALTFRLVEEPSRLLLNRLVRSRRSAATTLRA